MTRLWSCTLSSCFALENIVFWTVSWTWALDRLRRQMGEILYPRSQRGNRIPSNTVRHQKGRKMETQHTISRSIMELQSSLTVGKSSRISSEKPTNNMPAFSASAESVRSTGCAIASAVRAVLSMPASVQMEIRSVQAVWHMTFGWLKLFTDTQDH